MMKSGAVLVWSSLLWSGHLGEASPIRLRGIEQFDACHLIKQQFDGDVSCSYDLYPADEKMDFHIQYSGPICVEEGYHHACGIPSYQGTIQADYGTSATVCIDDLTSTYLHQQHVYPSRVCVSATYCSYSAKVCSCTATFDGENCNSCSVCGDGSGVALDCSNVHEGLQPTQCTSFKGISGFRGAKRSVIPIMPTFR